MFGQQVERIGLFIDGANLAACTKELGFFPDFSSILKLYQDRYKYLVCANYYSAVYRDASGHEFLRKMLNYLSYNGWVVIEKPTKEFRNFQTGEVKIKGNMDVEFCVDVLRSCKHVDHIIMWTGDGDFTYLVKECQSLGKRVTVVSSLLTDRFDVNGRKCQPMIADELRKQANTFVDVGSLITQIRRVDD